MREPKFDEVVDFECICPYCGLNYQVESEDYDESERVDTCYGCGKKYYMRQEFTVETITIPDCELNGEEHEFIQYTTVNGEFYRCVVCNKRKYKK